MNKAEPVDRIASQVGLTKRVSREAVDAITSLVFDTLTRWEKLTLAGFWDFSGYEKESTKRSQSSNKKSDKYPSQKSAQV